ncbi:synaptonemal complex protein 1-like [Copidosoma floridanum]|uniref:synaptonemal complex protein 1-like n=1 Tax=Copidosoma floridanum TaxID=29053 RepID=UPI0006C961EB|nr:synaptonemal complex protein 1-like [Copidosoma floridanum]
MELEKQLSYLQTQGLQVSMENLKNPTEDFMVYLITEYLVKLYLDANEIAKPTVEQLDCLSCPDSVFDAIKVINVYTALSSICNEIFLKDLCLMDVISPGPKKAKMLIKILINFFVYFRNKMGENEVAFVQLDGKKKYMDDIIDEKDSLVAKIGATIHERENKIELRQQLQQEIDKITLEIKSDNKILRELEYQDKEVTMQHQDNSKKCNDLKSKALKLHKVTTELQSKIVKSPENYAARSKELNKLLELKKEERQVLTDAITQKQSQIKSNENAQELVKELNEKFLVNTNETRKELKETSEKLEYVQKEVDRLKTDIEKWSNLDENQLSSIIENEDAKRYEQLLSELGQQCQQRERELHSKKSLLQELKNDFNNKKTLVKSAEKILSIAEKECSELKNQYKEFYENEIAQELEIRETIETTISKTNTKLSCM